MVQKDHRPSGQGRCAPVEPMPKKPRTKVLRIRVSADERLAIERAGDAVGLGPSTFSRMAAIRAAGLKPAPPPRRRPDEHAVALARWTGELNRIGVNMNQVARDHNSGVGVDPALVEDLRSELRQLRETILTFHASPPGEPS